MQPTAVGSLFVCSFFKNFSHFSTKCLNFDFDFLCKPICQKSQTLTRANVVQIYRLTVTKWFSWPAQKNRGQYFFLQFALSGDCSFFLLFLLSLRSSAMHLQHLLILNKDKRALKDCNPRANVNFVSFIWLRNKIKPPPTGIEVSSVLLVAKSTSSQQPQEFWFILAHIY